ncbi:transcription termination/antitermination protein NusG [Candidatus Phytoplasma solani]|uniref:Transcription termination/antitermination protein NusG n=1 Tax=Candidatus Phytoplasma solani TaxID=69896 RepID=A0A421NYV1_9MOLU|nr:transcription termination/antitermination protein NusG [Candidatus Phytoplasma solani]RMI89144.1 transcription antitermination protein [Candidatus Phytoplasma solani]CCP88398.1 Transcription antitermination protein NusG [Candidatus Phytoplasma solani]
MKKEKVAKNTKPLEKIIETKPESPLLQWYIAQTYSGYENIVKEDLLRRVDSIGINDLVANVLSPKEVYYETRSDGKKTAKERKIYPGYIFIQMIITDRSWFVVKNTPRITGFLGSSGVGSKPVPLSEKDINPVLLKMGIINKPNYDHLLGKKVEIISGSFANQQGQVSIIDNDREKMIVEVDLFGRSTPVEISFNDFKEMS